MTKSGINRPVPEMCSGCYRDQRNKCEVITEPAYIYKHRGSCFARMNAYKAKSIEKDIAFIAGYRLNK
jgi:hypothetical protein